MISVCRNKDIIASIENANQTQLRTFAEQTLDKLSDVDFTRGASFLMGSGASGKVGAYLASECAKRKIAVKAFVEDTEGEKIVNLLLSSEVKRESLSLFKNSAGVVFDCLSPDRFTKKQPRDFVCAAKTLNDCTDCIKISVLSPYGLNPDTGIAAKTVVKADKTLCFSAAVPGLLLSEGLDYSGEIMACGQLPAVALGHITDENYAAFPPRKRVSHKGTYGKIAIIGGSDTMPGAPLMAYGSAVAASVSGAGLVRLCVGENEKCAYKSRVLEQTLFFLPEKNGFICFNEEKLRDLIAFADVIVLGPGMGNNPFLPEITDFLCKNYTKTLILDADALNAVAKNPGVICGHACKLVLTPHIGEFARLAPQINPYDVKKVKAFAKKNKCVLALKSACTVITDGKRMFFNTSGTPALAKGGSGDVLSGIIAAYAAICPPIEAAAKACYRFGKTAEKVACLTGEQSLLARDVIAALEEGSRR